MDNFEADLKEIEALEDSLLEVIGNYSDMSGRVKELRQIVASTPPDQVRAALEDAGFLSINNIYKDLNLKEVEVSTEKSKIVKIISAIIEKIIRLFEKIMDINKSLSGKLNKLSKNKLGSIGNIDEEKFLDINTLVYPQKAVDNFLSMAGRVDLSKTVNKDDSNLSSTLDTSFVKIVESLGFTVKDEGIVPGEKAVLVKARVGDIGWDVGKVKNGVDDAEKALIHIRKHTDTLGRTMKALERKAEQADDPKAMRAWIKNIRKTILWVERQLIIISKQMLSLGNALVTKK